MKYGWAKLGAGLGLDDSSEPVEVHLCFDGDPVSHAKANLHRPDLDELGYGPCAFEFDAEIIGGL